MSTSAHVIQQLSSSLTSKGQEAIGYGLGYGTLVLSLFAVIAVLRFLYTYLTSD